MAEADPTALVADSLRANRRQIEAQSKQVERQQRLMQQDLEREEERRTVFMGRHREEDKPSAISSTQRSILAPSIPPLYEVEFKEVSGCWSRVYEAQLLALRCADTLTAKEGDEVKLDCRGFNSNGVAPERLRKANEV